MLMFQLSGLFFPVEITICTHHPIKNQQYYQWDNSVVKVTCYNYHKEKNDFSFVCKYCQWWVACNWYGERTSLCGLG
jgi:hypothetical protein